MTERNRPMVNVGASPESIMAARAAILDILKADADQSTKAVALNALVEVTGIKNTTITNCTFTHTGEAQR